MARRGKKYRNLVQSLDQTKLYGLAEALENVKKASFSKFRGGIDLSMNLGVDPRHADQNVRGACVLPKGLGKTVRVIVFAKGQKAIEAKESGADFVGGDDLAKKITEGWLDFDQIIATPDMMAVVGRLGKVLGPRGLMPNPKLGSVTFDVAEAIKASKAGRAEFKVDKAGIVHASVGHVEMSDEDLKQNVEAIVDTVVKLKPSSSKGTYLKKLTVSATMGLSFRVDCSPFV